MTSTLCHMAAENSFVPTYEGIDPPLLDPTMVEHFNKMQSPQPVPRQTNGDHQSQPPLNLQGHSLDDLIKIVAQLCESDPTFSDQILSSLAGSADSSVPEQPQVSSPMLQSTPLSSPGQQQLSPDPNHHSPVLSSSELYHRSPVLSSPVHSAAGTQQFNCPDSSVEMPLPDTNTLLKTLNQSILLQEYSNTLALQLAGSNRLQTTGVTSMDTSQASNALILNSESLEAMKSNLFVLENKGTNFVPMKDFKRPGPKYTRKNFSPEQIEGLETAFQEHRFVKKELRKQLAKQLNLSERSISYWFQNKRARSKPPITMSSEAALKAASQQHSAQALAEHEARIQSQCAT